MTIRIGVNDAAWDALVAQYQTAAPAMIADEGVAMLTEMTQFLERQVVLGEPENLGKLKQGTVSGVDVAAGGRVTGYVGVEGPASQYVWPVELGARPHWPPMDAMIQYVRDKQLSWVDKRGRPMSVRSMAYVIGRAISRRGTIARFGASEATPAGDGEIGGAHMGRNALVQGQSVLQQLLHEHTRNLAERLRFHLGSKP